MTPYEFVDGFRHAAFEMKLERHILMLRSGPPGRRPHKSLVDRSRWFMGMSSAEQAAVEQVCRAPLYRAALACLAVVDGEPRERVSDAARSRLRLLARKHGRVVEITGHPPGLSRLFTDRVPPNLAYVRKRPRLADSSSQESFVAMLRREALEGAVEDTLAALRGQTTAPDLTTEQARWFTRADLDDQRRIERFMLSVAHRVVFSFLAIFDGVAAVEDDEVKSEFQLLHSNDGVEIDLTVGEHLHDVLGIIEGDE